MARAAAALRVRAVAAVDKPTMAPAYIKAPGQGVGIYQGTDGAMYCDGMKIDDIRAQAGAASGPFYLYSKEKIRWGALAGVGRYWWVLEMGGGCAVLRRLQRPRAAACTCLFTRAAAALVTYQSRIPCPHALPAACSASLLPPPYCSVCCRQNYQAYQEALQGLDSIVGYAVKANNNFKIMQVGGLPLLLGALGGAAGATSLAQCC